ncbi:hypothetical protein XENOCAPTIV_017847, partial [Xenoophorus captivus]
SESGQQPAFLTAIFSVQPDQTQETQPQSQPHCSCSRLCLQHEDPGASSSARNQLSTNNNDKQMIQCSPVFLQVFLDLSSNRLENLAEKIQALVELKILIMEGNSLHSLPKALCFLTRCVTVPVPFLKCNSCPSCNTCVSHDYPPMSRAIILE